MRAITRRLMVLLLCCWLPVQALAAMALECHLVAASSSAHHEPAPQAQAVDEHSGCGGAKTTDLIADNPVANSSIVNSPIADGADNLSACEHCQTSCHTSYWFVTFFAAESAIPIAQAPSLYALPLPQIVFIDSPQRPPQAV